MTQLYGFARNAFTVNVGRVVLRYVVYLLWRAWQCELVISRAAVLGVPLVMGLWAGVTLLTTSFIDFATHYEISQPLPQLNGWSSELLGLSFAVVAGIWAWRRLGLPRGLPVMPPLLILTLAVLLGAVLVLFGLGFADAFIERVLPFYLEVRL